MSTPIFREEPGSCITFGPFAEENFYDIENSKVLGTRSNKLKSVEFLALHNKKLVFVEAKKTSPKSLTTQSAQDDVLMILNENQKASFHEWSKRNVIKPSYVVEICEKFVISMCLAISIATGLIPNSEMTETMIKEIQSRNLEIVFVLVITWSNPEWAKGAQEAFNKELQKYKRTNNASLLVLTAEQAKHKGLVSSFTPDPDPAPAHEIHKEQQAVSAD